MLNYTAPLRDIEFVARELLDSDTHYKSLKNCEALSPDLLEAILEGGAKFSEQVIAPLNQSGDEQGCHFEHGKVQTPSGFKQAFEQYTANGWQGLSSPIEFGGQGLPGSCGMMVGEMVSSANHAWSMYGGLSHAPITCLLAAGTDEQKQTYLPNLINGRWAGTMCLTEAHCGSDVGLVRTKACDSGEGHYIISGSKIFISGGEQDITENIIHAVLARIDGAPAGTKGISLFLVPKVNLDGTANAVSCGSIEKKMGLKASSTCAMNFDGAKGFLLGEENRGLEVMFKIMNTARLGTALQGVSLAEASFQGALNYARERQQMRALSGTTNPEGEADPIIVHPDVRRMLMTQKTLTEGSRALIYWLAQLVDKTKEANEEEAKSADDLLSMLTPIAKAFCTETGVEVTNIGIQVLGGHGYIRDNGMEQLARDMRIATLYEGTTGIQALDLLGRKVLGSQGELLRSVTKLIHKFCEGAQQEDAMLEFTQPLQALNKQWGDITMTIGAEAVSNHDELGAASVDYTMFSGYVVLAYMWAQMAQVAQQKMADGSEDSRFYRAKLTSARFYFKRLLPRAGAHAAAATSLGETLMALPADDFAF
mgnify:CR=1 FL=1